jgi:hypothetical protein
LREKAIEATEGKHGYQQDQFHANTICGSLTQAWIFRVNG